MYRAIEQWCDALDEGTAMRRALLLSGGSRMVILIMIEARSNSDGVRMVMLIMMMRH
ncbi:MAG TPA: hypothetical protein VMG12_11225 [Polyangiaceae bacterium]|nr:hypothetical protein [Polyangiaceae bacterium]